MFVVTAAAEYITFLWNWQRARYYHRSISFRFRMATISGRIGWASMHVAHVCLVHLVWSLVRECMQIEITLPGSLSFIEMPIIHSQIDVAWFSICKNTYRTLHLADTTQTYTRDLHPIKTLNATVTTLCEFVVHNGSRLIYCTIFTLVNHPTHHSSVWPGMIWGKLLGSNDRNTAPSQSMIFVSLNGEKTPTHTIAVHG